MSNSHTQSRTSVYNNRYILRCTSRQKEKRISRALQALPTAPPLYPRKQRPLPQLVLIFYVYFSWCKTLKQLLQELHITLRFTIHFAVPSASFTYLFPSLHFCFFLGSLSIVRYISLCVYIFYQYFMFFLI